MKKRINPTVVILLALLLSSITGYTLAKYIKTFPSETATVTFTARLADNMTITPNSVTVIPGYDEAYATYTITIENKTEIPATLTVTIDNEVKPLTGATAPLIDVDVDTSRLAEKNTDTSGNVLWTASTSGSKTTFTYHNKQLSAKNQDVTITLIVPLTVSQYVKQIGPTDIFSVSAKLDEYVNPTP